VNYFPPLDDDGSGVTSVIADLSPLRCYRLPPAIFDFVYFKPQFGVEQPEGLAITYKLA
jgi:hypothetical protein